VNQLYEKKNGAKLHQQAADRLTSKSKNVGNAGALGRVNLDEGLNKLWERKRCKFYKLDWYQRKKTESNGME
jgi:hypothetical protein